MTVFQVVYCMVFQNDGEVVEAETNLLYPSDDAQAAVNELYELTFGKAVTDPRNGSSRVVTDFKLKSVTPLTHVDMLSPSMIEEAASLHVVQQPGDVRSNSAGL